MQALSSATQQPDPRHEPALGGGTGPGSIPAPGRVRQPGRLQQIMFWMQWVTPIIAITSMTVGRVILGQRLGWATLIISVFAVLIIPLWWYLCGLTLTQRANRATMSLPLAAAWLQLVALVLFLVSVPFIEDAGDMSPEGFESFARRLFGLSDAAADIIALVLIASALVCFVVAIFFSLMPRRAGTEPAANVSSPGLAPTASGAPHATGRETQPRVTTLGRVMFWLQWATPFIALFCYAINTYGFPDVDLSRKSSPVGFMLVAWLVLNLMTLAPRHNRAALSLAPVPARLLLAALVLVPAAALLSSEYVNAADFRGSYSLGAQLLHLPDVLAFVLAVIFFITGVGCVLVAIVLALLPRVPHRAAHSPHATSAPLV